MSDIVNNQICNGCPYLAETGDYPEFFTCLLYNKPLEFIRTKVSIPANSYIGVPVKIVDCSYIDLLNYKEFEDNA